MIRFFVIIFSIATCYFNYKVYRSYSTQANVIFDFNKQEFNSENFIKLKNLDISFPNLSATAFPLYALLAKYQIMFQDYNGAINTLHSNGNVNPYMRIKESLLSEAYYNLGIRDSSYFYSKIAYENLPLNARHFQQYITELTHKKDLNKINEIFEKSQAKKNSQYWLFYLSAVINLKGNEEKKIDSIAREGLRKFPKNNKIKSIASYILMGQANVKKSYELSNRGIEFFEKSKFTEASDMFIEAYNLNQIDYSFAENAGMSLINTGDFKKAIEYFQISIDNSDKPKDGKSEFGIGFCYKGMKMEDLACQYFKKAMESNYKPAFKEYSALCK